MNVSEQHRLFTWVKSVSSVSLLLPTNLVRFKTILNKAEKETLSTRH